MADVKNKKDLKIRNIQLDIEAEKADLKEKKPSNSYVGIVGIVVGLIILIIAYSDNIGSLGQVFFTILNIIFGRGLYILPLFLIGYSTYYITKKSKIQKENTVYLTIIFFIFVASFHIVSVDMDVMVNKSFGASIVDTVSDAGGWSGSIIGTIEIGFFGQSGAVVFNILILVLLISLMSGKTLITTWMFFASKIKEESRKLFDNRQSEDIDSDFENDEPENEESHGGLFDFVVGKYDDEEWDSSEMPQDSFEGDGIILPSEHIPKAFSSIEPEEIPVVEEEILITEYPEPILVDDEAPEIISDGDDEYKFPPIDLIKKNPGYFSRNIKSQITETKNKLQQTLKSFGVNAIVTDAFRGPTVTRYEISPGEGVKVSRISSLSDDIALNLAAPAIRIEAPIPGKPVIGIEIPNKEPQTVYLREIIESQTYKNFPSKVSFAIGKDIEGNEVVSDITKMPHLLIAGATGSGKSVCINTLIISLLYKSRPEEVKLLMIDPKVVELSVYNGIPHLMIPVVTDPKKAAGALNWAVREMTDRYNLFSNSGVRDISGYNNKIKNVKDVEPMPNIVIIIDELADLMMTAQNEVEDSIGRLAQMARAAGIHLIIATQRPSVDVITGVIKANIPSRLAFAVSSGTDSRTILDMVGAEKLLGKGDMLFYPMGMNKPQRIQGAFVSDKEVEGIVKFFKAKGETEYNEDMIKNITTAGSSKKEKGKENPEELDEFFLDAMEFVITKQKASISLVQRQFRIGYNRAARIMEEFVQLGVVGSEDGSKPRKVIWTLNEFEDYRKSKGE